ncbi:MULTISPECIES: 3-oxoacyl-ACP synthase III family protein [Spirosoma]|uniref:Ketoacyl-ACP synthase III n=1 Tax=Spirosoma liriopis TaxID=2937440 RepID=A0ABT0HTU2_9BACT|nr:MULTISPECIES: ketoacyl-ACP synthase III [Spirosoma]MCK8495618.1 ketoacyl-ACP synthase III [Spirosoma liriopis]UHG94497.1 ketoacyl-ACP synthase III [Spirosoma oryzicola]
MIRSVIAATGSCIPDTLVRNQDFLATQFFTPAGIAITTDKAVILDRFEAISGIQKRRYARPDQKASDLGLLAAGQALTSAGFDPETLDYLIVAHNFGDVAHQTNRVDLVPSLASRIKAGLAIKNSHCVAYDLAFGCPGWLEGVIQANYYIRSGDAQRCLIIGTETLSRVIDPSDRDSLLFSDGSGAIILEASPKGVTGILSHHTQTHAYEHADLLKMGNAYDPDQSEPADRFMKMNGRKLYEFALLHVPLVIKTALDKAGISISAVKKILIHQANHKMNVAILERLFKLYGQESPDLALMPMTISWLGNSSVATIPTLLDLVQRGQLANQRIEAGDTVVLASVGAGMNSNAVVYQF